MANLRWYDKDRYLSAFMTLLETLSEEVQSQVALDILGEIPKVISMDIAVFMDYVEKNDYLINCAYDSIGCDEMKRFFYADFIEIVSAVIDTAEKNAGTNLDKEYKSFLCNFYTEALAGILIDLIRNRDSRNQTQVIDYLSTTLKDSLTGILHSNIDPNH